VEKGYLIKNILMQKCIIFFSIKPVLRRKCSSEVNCLSDYIIFIKLSVKIDCIKFFAYVVHIVEYLFWLCPISKILH
jgi:hypothetical protein